MARILSSIVFSILIGTVFSLTCDDNKYKSINPTADDFWCRSNCMHNPPNCPESHCACDEPSPSPTKRPTNAPTAPTTPSPTKATPTPTIRPTNCGECPVCEGVPTQSPIPTQQPTPRPNGPFPQNCNCVCYGDPHCKMWNCAINNWQGPRGVYPPGQVYYMTRCHGQTLDKMPFDVIASIQRYSHDFTAIDYTILKIYNPNDENDFYCIKIKGNDGVRYNDDCSDHYDQRPHQKETVSFFDGKFKLEWYFGNGYAQLILNIDGDSCSDDIVVISQTVTSTEEAVEIKVSDCYKSTTCGMCGNFYDTGMNFERIDGSHMTLDEGRCWGGTANDNTGLSYLIDGTMGDVQRRLQIVTDEIEEEADQPCFGLIDKIETECVAGVQSDTYADCCSERSEYCAQDIVLGCKWDACSCIMDEADSLIKVNNEGILNECVSKILSNAMSFICNLPSDDFIIPDMTIYENQQEMAVVNDNIVVECEDNSVSSIFIGIAIGAIICIVINVIIYFVIVKPILNKKNETVNHNEAEQDVI